MANETPDRSPVTSGHDASPEAPRAPHTARPIDVSAMKAFAHPLRMQLYSWLRDHGEATASLLADHLNESTGQTSYHLRQLAKHGFVEEVTSRGTGRERWWRSVGFSMPGHEFAKDPTARPALELMLRTQHQQRAEVVRDWLERSTRESPAWVGASLDNTATVRMSARQMHELSQALLALIHEHSERAKASSTEEGETRVVRCYVDVLPLPEDGATSDAAAADAADNPAGDTVGATAAQTATDRR